MNVSKKYWYLVLGLLGIIVLIVIYGGIREKVASKIKDTSILFLDVSGSLPEAPVVVNSFLNEGKETPSFQQIIRLLAEAKTDDRIKLVVLKIETETLPAKILELHEAILDYRKSGKPIWGYVRFASDMDYFAASACSKIILEPYGELELNGISTQLHYFDKTLEAVGIDVEAVRVGKYKSAIESFTRNTPSEEDIEQRTALLDGFFNSYIDNVCKNRKLDQEAFKNVIDKVGMLSNWNAKKEKLIDTSLYFDDVKTLIADEFDIDKDNKEDYFVNASTYDDKFSMQHDASIAVINVMGTIQKGVSDDRSAGDKTIIKSLEDATKDDKVKAIILRVDSPGGGVTASDKIYRAVIKAKATKPVVVSMSNLAASGGYWISSGATKIIANPLTVSGSIGIFMLKPNLTELAKYAKVNSANLKRGELSDDFTIFKQFSPKAFNAIQSILQSYYSEFVKQVSVDRKKSFEQIDSIAQGRVWLGTNALKHGLVDKLGGFMDAINEAKELAHLEDKNVSIINYPKPKSFLQSVLRNEEEESLYNAFVQKIAKDATNSIFSKDNLGSFPAEFDQLKEAIFILRNAESATQAQARLPFTISVR